MLIQAIGTFTLETEGQKQPLVVGDGEFAEIANGAAKDAIEQGAARQATYEEYRSALASKEVNPKSSATDGDADEAPRRGKRSNPAKQEG